MAQLQTMSPEMQPPAESVAEAASRTDRLVFHLVVAGRSWIAKLLAAALAGTPASEQSLQELLEVLAAPYPPDHFPILGVGPVSENDPRSIVAVSEICVGESTEV